jgi:hypothetical protein
MTTHYVLQNKITGLFFDGTAFNAESASACVRFADAPNEVAIRSVWGENAQIVPVTTEHYYAVTVTYTTRTNRRVTRDFSIRACNPTEAFAKIAALIQTPEYQDIPNDKVQSIALSAF